MARVVIANPGANPELQVAASAAGSAGLIERYLAPVAVSARRTGSVRRVPGRVADRVATELERRRVPPGVPEDRVRSLTAAEEVARVAAARLGLTAAGTRLILHQARRFDRRVARSLVPSDGALLAVSAYAAESVRRARALGVRSVVDLPIAHPATVRELMREEARRVPEYAATLQGHDFPDSLISGCEAEYREADRLLVLAEAQRRTFVDRGVDPARMTTTPLGVDLDMFRPGERPDDGVFRVLFVGQITQRKGISYLVEAFRRAFPSGAELVLAGPVVGTSRPWASVPGVVHAPARPRAELAALYRAADVYVLPSLAEGFPLTTMEAMACGVPVIVSDRTAAHDIVGDGVEGYVVPVRDADAIAERLALLRADPDRRARMAAAARRRAERFPWSRYGDQVVGILREELARGSLSA